ncbi:hypothetical protein D3C75_647650 [compost metagenome]
MQRNFVHSTAVYYRRTFVSQYAQGFGNWQHQFRAINTNQRHLRVSRVNQRPEYVKQCACF